MEITHTIGRRKTAVARVYVQTGNGTIKVNNKDYKEYFPTLPLQNLIKQAFDLSKTTDQYDVNVNVFGGGYNGQAEAIRMALARALCKINAEYRPVLKANGLLTVIHVWLNVRSSVSAKHVVASSSVNVNPHSYNYIISVMINVTQEELLNAGVHFGHLKRKWNPKMAPYIFMERNGIHIIDLNKTHAKLEEAAAAVKQIAKSGKKILFVATKKQAKEIVAAAAKSVNMPYITERWPGGMLTNFATQRKSVKKMTSLDKMLSDGTVDNLSKKERLMMGRQKSKMEKLLGSIADLNRLPAALFIVDTVKEHIAVRRSNQFGNPYNRYQ
jgi:ribosomal protein S2